MSHDDLRVAAQAATPHQDLRRAAEAAYDATASSYPAAAETLRRLASPDRILALYDDNKELRAALTDLVKWADRFSASRTIQDELALAASLDEARAALEGKPE